MTRPTQRRRGTAVLLWGLQLVAAAEFLWAGTRKLTGATGVDTFEAIGVGQWFRYLTGAIEVGSALLLLLPWLATFGALALAVTMVGAVLTNLFITASSPVLPLALLAMTTTIATMRRSDLGAPYSPYTRLVMASAMLAPPSLAALVALAPAGAFADQAQSPSTFTKDVAPILQRSCQNCHRPNSVAPMSLITYEEVRPWARSIKQRTGLANKMGVMPPWFIDKHVGIQDYKDDISLSEEEIATIAAWVDAGAPQGNAADMPPARIFTAANEWALGEPDLVVDSPPVTMKANSPDWWGALAPVPTGLGEDRYVAAVEMKEVSSVRGGSGGKFIFHHAIHAMLDANGQSSAPIGSPHEVGRNAEFFEPLAGRLLTAGSQLVFPSVHMHANAEDTTAHLRVAYKFHPKGYKPERRVRGLTFGSGELDLRPMKAGQEVHFYTTLEQNMLLTTFEPHMHAAGVRMCMEAIWGGRTETLSCAGYDHNWVRVYKFADDAAPLLPKGTLIHVTAYFDTTPANKNVVDPRNWGGLGHRSIDNMAILITPTIVLTDQEFRKEIVTRRERLHLAKGQGAPGCPLCGFEQLPTAARPSRQPQ